MTFLVFTAEQDGLDAITSLNTIYGFPDGNTDTWANLLKAYNINEWYFFKPYQTIKDVTVEQAMATITVPYTEIESIPSDWIPPAE